MLGCLRIETVRGSTIRTAGLATRHDALRPALRSWARSRELIAGLEIRATSRRAGCVPGVEIRMAAGAYSCRLPLEGPPEDPALLHELMDATHERLARFLREGPAGGPDGPPHPTDDQPPPPIRRGRK